MKHSVLRSLFAVTIVFAAAAAHAQSTGSSLYGEIGYNSVSVTESGGGLTVKFKPDLLTGVIGYRLNPNLSVEGLLGFGIGDDEITLNGMASGVMGEMGTTYGVFLRPSMAVSESVELFGRVGFVRNTLKLSGPGGSASLSDTGLAYGIGANFNLSKTSYLQANWTSYYNDDGMKLQGIGVAWGMNF
ncbi:MAG: porin family protein [Hydrogenophaga sp.]|jgi:hypothetical protein|nr:porin family protein [Hydrogenophaga sp.]